MAADSARLVGATIRVIDERVAYLVSDILSDPKRANPGVWGEQRVEHRTPPAAAKTGTTTDFRDNWVVGFTPNLVVGVWVGNADNTPMVDVTGVSGAAPIWNAFMREVLIGKPELDFNEPPGLVRREICALSGLLATPECPRRRVELFIDGTQPTEPDDIYQTFTLDRRTGGLADDTTPRKTTLSVCSRCCRRKRATGGGATESRCRRWARRCG